MIVKNEERYLEDCLISVKDVVDEIIIVDTGSTDNTLKIAKKFNAKIFGFNWINDFSAARNYALRQCTGNFILYLDADERLLDESKPKLKEILKAQEKLAVNCLVISNEGGNNTQNVMSYYRLFSNSENIFFTGAVHEQIFPSLKENNYTFIDSDIKIIHVGYEVSQQKIIEKAKRNLEILLKDFKNTPTGYKAYHIGVSYVVLGEIDKSIPYFEEAIKDDTLEANHLSHCYRYLAAYQLNSKKDLEKALVYANKGLSFNKKQPLLNIILSNIYLYKGDFDKSEEYCRLAYEFNKELSSTKIAFFDIIVEENQILQHILNIAALTANKQLFNDYFPKLNLNKIDKNWANLFLLFNLLFNNLEITQDLIDNFSLFFRYEYTDSFLTLINNYKNVSLRVSLLKTAERVIGNKLGLIHLLGESYYLINDEQEALNYFEKYYKLDNKNTLVINRLITLYLNFGKFKELKKLLDDTANLFIDMPDIYEMISKLKDKLNELI